MLEMTVSKAMLSTLSTHYKREDRGVCPVCSSSERSASYQQIISRGSSIGGMPAAVNHSLFQYSRQTDGIERGTDTHIDGLFPTSESEEEVV
jgi:hypothetical protein